MPEWTWAQALPAINACFNATSATLLLFGWLAIKKRQVALHKRLMLSALASSALFLIGYLARVALTGTHRFVGPPAVRLTYLVLLVSHMILAVALLPMLYVVLLRAFRGRFAEHRRLARVVWPVWMYVSVTGVVVYWMLYWLLPQLAT